MPLVVLVSSCTAARRLSWKEPNIAFFTVHYNSAMTCQAVIATHRLSTSQSCMLNYWPGKANVLLRRSPVLIETGTCPPPDQNHSITVTGSQERAFKAPSDVQDRCQMPLQPDQYWSFTCAAAGGQSGTACFLSSTPPHLTPDVLTPGSMVYTEAQRLAPAANTTAAHTGSHCVPAAA